MHGFECKSNGDEIYYVVDMKIILNFLEFENGCSRKFKIITMSTTDHISSEFILYLNLCTYLEIAASILSYVAFPVSINDHNLCKKSGLLCMAHVM